MDEIEKDGITSKLDNIFDIIYAKAVYNIQRKIMQSENCNEANIKDYFFQVDTEKIYSEFVTLVNISNIPDQARVSYQVQFLQSPDWKKTVFRSSNRIARIEQKVKNMMSVETVFQ